MCGVFRVLEEANGLKKGTGDKRKKDSTVYTLAKWSLILYGAGRAYSITRAKIMAGIRNAGLERGLEDQREQMRSFLGWIYKNDSRLFKSIFGETRPKDIRLIDYNYGKLVSNGDIFIKALEYSESLGAKPGEKFMQSYLMSGHIHRLSEFQRASELTLSSFHKALNQTVTLGADLQADEANRIRQMLVSPPEGVNTVQELFEEVLGKERGNKILQEVKARCSPRFIRHPILSTTQAWKMWKAPMTELTLTYFETGLFEEAVKDKIITKKQAMKIRDMILNPPSGVICVEDVFEKVLGTTPRAKEKAAKLLEEIKDIKPVLRRLNIGRLTIGMLDQLMFVARKSDSKLILMSGSGALLFREGFIRESWKSFRLRIWQPSKLRRIPNWVARRYPKWKRKIGELLKSKSGLTAGKVALYTTIAAGITTGFVLAGFWIRDCTKDDVKQSEEGAEIARDAVLAHVAHDKGPAEKDRIPQRKGTKEEPKEKVEKKKDLGSLIDEKYPLEQGYGLVNPWLKNNINPNLDMDKLLRIGKISKVLLKDPTDESMHLLLKYFAEEIGFEEVKDVLKKKYQASENIAPHRKEFQKEYLNDAVKRRLNTKWEYESQEAARKQVKKDAAKRKAGESVSAVPVRKPVELLKLGKEQVKSGGGQVQEVEEKSPEEIALESTSIYFEEYPRAAQFLAKALRNNQATPENLGYLLETARTYLGYESEEKPGKMNDENCLIFFRYIAFARTTVPFAGKVTMPTNAAGKRIVIDEMTKEDVFGLIRAGNRKMRMFKSANAIKDGPYNKLD